MQKSNLAIFEGRIGQSWGRWWNQWTIEKRFKISNSFFLFFFSFSSSPPFSFPSAPFKLMEDSVKVCLSIRLLIFGCCRDSFSLAFWILSKRCRRFLCARPRPLLGILTGIRGWQRSTPHSLLYCSFSIHFFQRDSGATKSSEGQKC